MDYMEIFLKCIEGDIDTSKASELIRQQADALLLSGKIKEYDQDDNLIFEGDCINGKRNGKGKEYDYNGKLEFEGEYLNGKRNGKGKEYNEKGVLIFEGEYKNGNEW